MRRVSFCALLAVLLLVLASPPRGRAASRDRIYRNPDCGIRVFEVPRGWQVVPRAQVGYPRVLLLAERERAHLVLAVQGIQQPMTAMSLAEKTLQALREQRWEKLSAQEIGRVARIEGELDGGRRVLRQAYVLSDEVAYVLTVVAPREVSERVLRDFETALQSLAIEPLPTGAGGTSQGLMRCK
jgi:hypothetical protein